MPRRAVSLARGIALAMVWACLVFMGFARLSAYGLTAGAHLNAPIRLPSNVSVTRRQGLPTLIMVLHPMCPCSRASLAELNSLLLDYGSAISTNVIFVPPAGKSDDIQNTELWRTASQLSGGHLIVDCKGVLARQLGATTSGQVLLYDAEGRLQFSGGITASRGHAGANTGISAIETLIRHETPAVTDTPVFGCELW